MRFIFFLLLNGSCFVFSQVLDGFSLLSNRVTNSFNSNYKMFYNPSLSKDTSSYCLAGSVSALHQGIEMLDVVIGGEISLGRKEVGLTFFQESLYDYVNQEVNISLTHQLFTTTKVALQAGVKYSNLVDEGNYRGKYSLFFTQTQKDLIFSFHYKLESSDYGADLYEVDYKHSGYFSMCFQSNDQLHFLSNITIASSYYLSFGFCYWPLPDFPIIVSFSPEPASFGVLANVKINNFKIGVGLSYQPLFGISTSLLSSYVQ